jgi:hypothetical protein
MADRVLEIYREIAATEAAALPSAAVKQPARRW